MSTPVAVIPDSDNTAGPLTTMSSGTSAPVVETSRTLVVIRTGPTPRVRPSGIVTVPPGPARAINWANDIRAGGGSAGGPVSRGGARFTATVPAASRCSSTVSLRILTHALGPT